ICIGYTGSDPIGTGGASSVSFTLASPETLTWRWRKQFYFDIRSEHSSGCAGLIGWYDTASVVVACVSESIVYDGSLHRWVFDRWSGDASGRSSSHSSGIVMDTAKVATALWAEQFYLTLSYSGTGGATPVLTGAGWYTSGVLATISAEGSVYDDTIPYIFDHWVSSCTITDSTSSTTTVLVNAPCIATAQYRLWLVEVIFETNIDGGSIIVDGVTRASPCTLNLYMGSAHTIGVDSIVSVGEGERYVFESWSDGGEREHRIVISGSGRYIARFRKQYRLVISNPEGIDHPTPEAGEYWLDSATVVTASVELIDTLTHHYSTGYIGSGSVSSDDTNFVEFLLTSPTYIEWQWAEMINITVQTSISGGQVIVDGVVYSSPYTARWVPGGSHTIGVPSPQPGPSGTRYVFSYWSDGGAQTHTVSPTISTTYTAYFTTEYQLTISSSPSVHGSPDPAVGTHWYTSGSNITASVTSPADESGGTRWRCIGYTGTGSVSSGTGASVTFTITSPTTITWNWVRQHTLLVRGTPAEISTASPPYGTNWLDEGSLLCSVSSP
ncbi:MAG: InlB B-repeat-containing protein, partial [bacterium]